MEISLNLLDGIVVSMIGVVCFLMGVLVMGAYSLYLMENTK